MEIDTMMEAGAVWTSRGCAVVVYHGGCVDGLFAAAVAERALKARGWQVELYAAEHKRPLRQRSRWRSTSCAWTSAHPLMSCKTCAPRALT